MALEEVSTLMAGNPLSVFAAQHETLFLLVIAWIAIWKGLALWKSARLNKPIWFIALLVINTFGILEIIYIFFISKMQSSNADSSIPIQKSKRRRKK